MMGFEIMGSEFMGALSFEKLLGSWCAVCLGFILWKVRQMSVLAETMSYSVWGVENNVTNAELRHDIGLGMVQDQVRHLEDRFLTYKPGSDPCSEKCITLRSWMRMERDGVVRRWGEKVTEVWPLIVSAAAMRAYRTAGYALLWGEWDAESKGLKDFLSTMSLIYTSESLKGYVEFAENENLTTCPEKPELNSIVWDFIESRDYLSAQMSKAKTDPNSAAMRPKAILKLLSMPEHMKPKF